MLSPALFNHLPGDFVSTSAFFDEGLLLDTIDFTEPPAESMCRKKPSEQFTICQINANPTLLLHLLLLKGVIKMRTRDYREFFTIQSILTWQESWHPEIGFESVYRVKNILRDVKICQNIASIKMILNGNELAANGPNDILMLLVLEWLHDVEMPYEVILSPSGIDHMWYAEKKYENISLLSSGSYRSYFRGSEDDDLSTRSFCSLSACLASITPTRTINHEIYEKKKRLRSELALLYEKYKKHLKILDYIKTADGIILIFNTAISFQHVRELASHLSRCVIKYLDKEALKEEVFDSACLLGKTISESNLNDIEIIEKMNALFKKFIQYRGWFDLFFNKLRGNNPILKALQLHAASNARMKSATSLVEAQLPSLVYDVVVASKPTLLEAHIIERPLMEKIKPGRVFYSEQVNEIEVNLDVYPTVFQSLPKAFVVPDTHANPLFKIHIFMIKKVVWMLPDDYYELVKIFDAFNSMSIGDAMSFVDKLRDYLWNKIFFHVDLSELVVTFLGDDLADRGPNDLVTLLFFQLLHDRGVRYEILISNHSYEHIRQAAKGYAASPNGTNRACLLLKEEGGYANSLLNFLSLIASFPELKQLSQEIYHDVYKAHLKLMTSRKRVALLQDEEPSITLMYHACVGMKTIEANVAIINQFLKARGESEIELKKRTIDELSDSIHVINEAFQTVLDELLEKSDDFILDPVHPLRKIIWERHDGKVVEEAFDGMYAPNSLETSDYQIHVVHGHSGIEGVYPSLKNCTSNIDGDVGKPGHNKGILRTIDWY